jgi:thymidylate synthase (FAD)
MTKAVTFLNDVSVELVKHSASDEDVIHAARVSTQAEASLIDQDHMKGAGLINFLMRERHGSPFEHTSFTFLVSAPIFVFREWHRHRTWSYNEESGRYRELRPTFYIPSEDRPLVQQGKPGAYEFVEGTYEQSFEMHRLMTESYHLAYRNYQKMLDLGIAREVARMVLPVGIFSTMYATCNARALMHFLSLRTFDETAKFVSHPQREIEMAAEQMEHLFYKVMPLTYAAFNKNGRVAP